MNESYRFKEDYDKDELNRIKKVDLINFPPSIEDGVNCFNCRFIKNKERYEGFCSHPDIKVYVTDRMCCNKWDRLGTTRAWEK